MLPCKDSFVSKGICPNSNLENSYFMDNQNNFIVSKLHCMYYYFHFVLHEKHKIYT